MSSRSIGVTKVEFSRWMMSWVMRSPSCSQTTTSRASSPWSGHWSSICSSSSAARTMLEPASSNKSKNSRSLGANSWDRRAMTASVCKGLGSASGHAAARRANGAPEPFELLRGDAVGVLGTGEDAATHLLGVRPHPAHHLLADRRVLLDELRLEALVDREQVVEHHHLAVRARARADADDRHLHELRDHVGPLGRDRLEDDREAAGLLQGERVLEHGLGPLGRTTL